MLQTDSDLNQKLNRNIPPPVPGLPVELLVLLGLVDALVSVCMLSLCLWLLSQKPSGWLGWTLLQEGVCLCGQKQRITAEAGQDSVTLPCEHGKETEIIAVEWIRPDLDPDAVLLYRDGRVESDGQHPSFRNRVDLQDRQMKDGDASLILKNSSLQLQTRLLAEPGSDLLGEALRFPPPNRRGGVFFTGLLKIQTAAETAAINTIPKTDARTGTRTGCPPPADPPSLTPAPPSLPPPSSPPPSLPPPSLPLLPLPPPSWVPAGEKQGPRREEARREEARRELHLHLWMLVPAQHLGLRQPPAALNIQLTLNETSRSENMEAVQSRREEPRGEEARRQGDESFGLQSSTEF
ncbi:unnamed protein product [Menidia menidia]|uniref:(Atlantic silverside) hypothetical protein n=1 Tax=Menidia menidia TaxID=238744 RepID=A0A8S4BH06_9TELE|nr:unnamed protein product [Menidia menidia]